MNDGELLEKAKMGRIERSEIADVARALRSQDSGRDPYTLIHILGRSGAIEYQSLVVECLEARHDPMVARIALQVLCAYWNRASRHRDVVERFARGVVWDVDDEVRLAAISIAGEMLRERTDVALLRLLLELFEEEAGAGVRQAAYFALARASGREWSALPPATRRLDLENEVDPAVIAWAHER